MKKRQRRGFFKAMGGVFNFPMWIGTDKVKSFGSFIATEFKTLFVPNSSPRSEKTETFTEALERLQLTEEELNSRGRALYRMSLLLLMIGLLLFSYSIFLLVQGAFHGCFLALSLTGLSLAIGFRYHFWSFQIKERQLGCSLKAWYRYVFRGEKR